MTAEFAPLDRIRQTYADELDGWDIFVAEWNTPDTKYELRVSPKDASWTRSIGPVCNAPEMMEMFLRGLAFDASYIDQKASNPDS